MKRKKKQGLNRRSFIQEALAGDYSSFSEDRLSQLLAASFNNSASVRSAFLRFVGYQGRFDGYTWARTQEEYHIASGFVRTDVEILNGNRVIVVAENKVDSRLTARQLRNYASVPDLRSAMKIALVKKYFVQPGGSTNWRILHWHDLHQVLSRSLRSRRSLSPVDEFIIRNFVQYLEDVQMDRATFISAAAITAMAKALHKIQREKRCWLSLKTPVFQTAQNFLDILEGVIDESRTSATFAARVRRRYKFNPALGSWGNPSDGAAQWPLSLETTIRLQKERNGITFLMVGLYMTKKGSHSIICRAADRRLHYIKEELWPEKSIELTRFSRFVMANWIKWLK